MTSPRSRSQRDDIQDDINSASQGTEYQSEGLNLREATQTSVVNASKEAIYKKLESAGVVINPESQTLFDRIIFDFSRAIALKCQHYFRSTPGLVFTSAPGNARDAQMLQQIENMARNISVYFADLILTKILRTQNAADGRGAYQGLFARIACEFFLDNLNENLTITEAGRADQSNILRTNTGQNLEQLRDLHEFITGQDKVRNVARIVQSSDFKPELIRDKAYHTYRAMSRTSGVDLQFVSNNPSRSEISSDHMKAILTLSTFEPAEKFEFYKQVIGQ